MNLHLKSALIVGTFLASNIAFAGSGTVINTTMACTNVETFDGLKLVESMLGEADLRREINHVLNTGACVKARRGQRVTIYGTVDGAFGGSFYKTNIGHIATSNVRAR